MRMRAGPRATAAYAVLVVRTWNVNRGRVLRARAPHAYVAAQPRAGLRRGLGYAARAPAHRPRTAALQQPRALCARAGIPIAGHVLVMRWS